MLIESWILVIIVLGIFILGLVGLGGWIHESEKNERLREENKALLYENKKLSSQLAHRIALDNIKVANEYHEEGKKND